MKIQTPKSKRLLSRRSLITGAAALAAYGYLRKTEASADLRVNNLIGFGAGETFTPGPPTYTDRGSQGWTTGISPSVPSAAIGTPSPDRIVTVGVSYEESRSLADIDRVEINGVTATVAVQNQVGGGGVAMAGGIFAAIVDAGTTCEIQVFNDNDSSIRDLIIAWSTITGCGLSAASTTQSSTTTGSASSVSPPAIVLDGAGVTIACCAHHNSAISGDWNQGMANGVDSNAGVGNRIIYEFLVGGASGSTSFTCSLSGSVDRMVGCVAHWDSA